MQYRPFKELNLSQLGFGTMRFPIKYNNEKLIDEKAAGQCLQPPSTQASIILTRPGPTTSRPASLSGEIPG